MKYTTALLALCLASGLTAAAQAKSMGHHSKIAPTMEQCQGGYVKTYSKEMHWSKSKFKKACKKMMHATMKHDGMMKPDGVKKDMPKKDMPKKDMPKKDMPKKDMPKMDMPKDGMMKKDKM